MSTPIVAAKALSLAERLGTYNKAVVGLIVAFLTAFTQAQPDGVSQAEWFTIAGTTLVATGAIWAVPMTPKWLATYGKSVAGFLVALVGSLAVATVSGDITQEAILNALLAGFLTFSGVVIAPNAASSDPVGPDGKLVPIPSNVKDALAVPGTTAVTTVQGTDGVFYIEGASDIPDPEPIPADPNFEEDGGPGEDAGEDLEARIVLPVENPDGKGI